MAVVDLQCPGPPPSSWAPQANLCWALSAGRTAPLNGPPQNRFRATNRPCKSGACTVEGEKWGRPSLAFRPTLVPLATQEFAHAGRIEIERAAHAILRFRHCVFGPIPSRGSVVGVSNNPQAPSISPLGERATAEPPSKPIGGKTTALRLTGKLPAAGPSRRIRTLPRKTTEFVSRVRRLDGPDPERGEAALAVRNT